MSYGAIISDFYGTLTTDKDEIGFWNEVTEEIIKRCYSSPSPLIAIRISKGKRELDEMKTEYKNGKLDYDELYTKLNDIVLQGTNFENIIRVVERYANESQERLQKNILEDIGLSKVPFKGIISTGYIKLIKNVLGEYKQFFNEINANNVNFMSDYNKEIDKNFNLSIRVVKDFSLKVNKHKGEQLQKNDKTKQNRRKCCCFRRL